MEPVDAPLLDVAADAAAPTATSGDDVSTANKAADATKLLAVLAPPLPFAGSLRPKKM